MYLTSELPIRTDEVLGARQVMTFAVLLLLACVIGAQVMGGLWSVVARTGDNQKYAEMAAAVEKGNLRLAAPTKFPWGFPSVIAAVSEVSSTNNVEALFIVSVSASLAATALAYMLWGPWVAVYFNVVDYTWLQFSAYGSSDSLFAALIFTSLLAARKRRYTLSCLVGAIATIVRPLGVLLLIILVPWALYEQGWRRAASAAVAATIVLTLYAGVMTLTLGDPLTTYHQYQHGDWFGGLPVTWPFEAIFIQFSIGTNIAGGIVRWMKLFFVAAQVVVLLAIALVPEVRARALSHSLETAFGLLYSIFLLVYNSPNWALGIHSRLLLPILPWLLWTIEPWLPKRWTVVAAVTVLAAFPFVLRSA
jgi:hypothetical protein